MTFCQEMYETLILIDQDTSIDGETLSAAIEGAFASAGSSAPKITGSGSSIKISWPGFTLELYHAKEWHVIEESAEIAAKYAKGKSKAEAIASCKERLEISGDDDPAMEHFNDYCYAVEAIEKLGAVYTFDSSSAPFMNL